ncbi:hypothetical protein HNY73_014009 [Argiope bruennichi]|uniref:Uncharacterized protein n=1 Tax=Argiope bruennichi TaxID=94029 RepID=A0A8T0ERL5_ARGBR|nr:hypothetical protein HNY73_014009 [Argiope bruennichi]
MDIVDPSKICDEFRSCKASISTVKKMITTIQTVMNELPNNLAMKELAALDQKFQQELDSLNKRKQPVGHQQKRKQMASP